MKVKIEYIRKGTYLPRAREVLAKMSYMTVPKCDRIIDDLSLRDISVTLALRGPFTGHDWDAFNELFVFNQIPAGPTGSAKQFVDDVDEAEWTDDDLSDLLDDEVDPTEMQLFCIKTEARTGHKYEILVLATTEEIALQHAIRDPAVVKSIKIWPGPFTNGTVLSTKLITK